MSIETHFRERCRQLAGISDDQALEPTTLVGFFQRFRPKGLGLQQLYRDMPRGDEYQRRLQGLFDAAGEDRRPSGGRDAYFVVREPAPMGPDIAEELANQWLTGLQQIASRHADKPLRDLLKTVPKVRVLEGMPPKQPKSDQASFSLLRGLKVDAAKLTDGVAVDCEVVSLLREAYYFTACDSMLRDYLLWPAYIEHFEAEDPLHGYFELWRHGIKWRIFHDDMIDIYLPPASASRP